MNLVKPDNVRMLWRQAAIGALLLGSAPLLSLAQMSDTQAAEGQSTPASSATLQSVDPEQVRALLTAKCARCHDAAHDRVEGDFGFVTDLKRVKEAKFLIVPGDPDSSDLWYLVESDLMPPPESDAPPLSPVEKVLIRDWIAAGAPLTSTSPAEDSNSPLAEPNTATAQSTTTTQSTTTAAQPEVPTDKSTETATEKALPFRTHLAHWLGTFHPASVHLPIGLILGGAFAALLYLWRHDLYFYGVARFCLWIAALGAAMTVGLGWMNAATGVFLRQRAEVVETHRWLGVSLAITSLLVAITIEWTARINSGPKTRQVVMILVIIAALLASLTGFQGGRLTHGLNPHAW